MLLTVILALLALSACGDTRPNPSDGAGSRQSPAYPTNRETAASPLPTPFSLAQGNDRPADSDANGPSMAAAADRLVDEEPGIVGVVIADQTGAIQYARNIDTPFLAASLYKLVLMADILARVESGELRPDSLIELSASYYEEEGALDDSYYSADRLGDAVSLDEALYAAGAFSSNIAARALLDLTTPESLNERAREIGLADTHFFVWPREIPGWPSTNQRSDDIDLREATLFVEAGAVDGPVNITTPGDMARFLFQLLNGRVGSPQVSAKIIEILSQQRIDDRIPHLLSPTLRTAHKTGNLKQVVHDVGVIYTDAGPVILAAMVEGHPNDERAAQLIQRLALIATGSDAIPPLTS